METLNVIVLDSIGNDISSLNNKDYILYHCCEELEPGTDTYGCERVRRTRNVAAMHAKWSIFEDILRILGGKLAISSVSHP